MPEQLPSSSDRLGSIGLLWRGDRGSTTLPPRLVPIFEALEREQIAASAVIYADDAFAEVREQLLALDGVLVWVDPISDGRDRRRLDPLLRDVATQGVWVSAHPDVILKMGVKEVLYRTRDLGWGTDTWLYQTVRALKESFPARLADRPRVLKQSRGNGGQGVWKVELAGADQTRPADPLVEVLHAQRGSQIERLPLSALLDRMETYFNGGGQLIEQPFQPRLPEGMIRCYLAGDRVVGFGCQLIKALLPPGAGEPGPRIMSGADDPLLQRLRALMETAWVPAMMQRLEIDAADLPAIWDADFLYGAKTPAGEDTYVLCEINVSAVLPIPDQAPAEIARRVVGWLTRS